MVTMITDSADSPIIRRRISRSMAMPRTTPLAIPTATAAGQGRPQVDLGVVDHEGADDEELALGEVDDLGGLVDEDETQRREARMAPLARPLTVRERNRVRSGSVMRGSRTANGAAASLGVNPSMLTIGRVMLRVTLVPSW